MRKFALTDLLRLELVTTVLARCHEASVSQSHLRLWPRGPGFKSQLGTIIQTKKLLMINSLVEYELNTAVQNMQCCLEGTVCQLRTKVRTSRPDWKFSLNFSSIKPQTGIEPASTGAEISWSLHRPSAHSTKNL